MYYCPHCLMLQEKETCACCGASPLYLPHPKDFCFLQEREAMWAEMLQDVLKDQGIPCVHKPVYGAALMMNVGTAMERYRLYVPYEHLLDARSIAEQLFDIPFQEAEN